jgi:hypothetical protein
MKINRLRSLARKHRLLFAILLLVIVAISYLVFIHKPSSPEFLVLRAEEQSLSFPKPWRRDTSDYGCQRPRFIDHDEIQCWRHIDLIYMNTGVKTELQSKLLSHSWTHYPEDKAMSLSGPDFDKSKSVRFDSWDLYAKTVNGKPVCAVVKLEYNANYKQSAPWAVSLDLFAQTERCSAHIGGQ